MQPNSHCDRRFHGELGEKWEPVAPSTVTTLAPLCGRSPWLVSNEVSERDTLTHSVCVRRGVIKGSEVTKSQKSADVIYLA